MTESNMEQTVDALYTTLKNRFLAFLFDLAIALLTSIGPYFIFNGNDMHIDFFYLVCIFFFLLNTFAYLQSGGERSPGDNYLRIRIVKMDTLIGSKFASIMRIFIILMAAQVLYNDLVLGVILLSSMIPVSLSPYYRNKKQMFWDIVTKTVVIEMR